MYPGMKTSLAPGAHPRAEQECQLLLVQITHAVQSDFPLSFPTVVKSAHTHIHTYTQGLPSRQPGNELLGVTTAKAKPLDSAGKVPDDASSH